MKLVKTVIFGLFMGLAPFICNGMESDDSDSVDIAAKMMTAIESDDFNQLQQIIESEYATKEELGSVMFLPVQAKNTAMTQFLINSKADIDYTHQDHDNKTLLHEALEYHDHIEDVRFIMQFNPSLTLKSGEDGDAALHWACLDTPEIVRIILEAQADIHQLNDYGNKPLEIAARYSSYPETINLLMHRGAVVTDDIIKISEDNSETNSQEIKRALETAQATQHFVQDILTRIRLLEVIEPSLNEQKRLKH